MSTDRHVYIRFPSGESGIDSGRPRYFVACLTCGVVLHESTTGPFAWDEMHERDTAQGVVPKWTRAFRTGEKKVITEFLEAMRPKLPMGSA